MSQYIITDGERFIYRNHSGKYVPTHGEAMADLFTKKQAESIYNHQLPKALKSVFHVERYDKPPDGVKQVNQNDLENNTEKVMIAENIQVWLDRLSDMNGLTKDILHRKEELFKQLHKLDDELLDIEHWIEFSRFNGVQGYMACKELKDCRLRRRTVKNEIQVLDIILGKNIEKIIGEEIQKRISEMDNRSYKPRVRIDLFDL